jgi:hypothetical protein
MAEGGIFRESAFRSYGFQGPLGRQPRSRGAVAFHSGRETGDRVALPLLTRPPMHPGGRFAQGAGGANISAGTPQRQTALPRGRRPERHPPLPILPVPARAPLAAARLGSAAGPPSATPLPLRPLPPALLGTHLATAWPAPRRLAGSGTGFANCKRISPTPCPAGATAGLAARQRGDHDDRHRLRILPRLRPCAHQRLYLSVLPVRLLWHGLLPSPPVRAAHQRAA